MDRWQTRALMRWYRDAGVDETVSDQPVDWFALAAAEAHRASARETRSAPTGMSEPQPPRPPVPAPAPASPDPWTPATIAVPKGAEAAIHDAYAAAAEATTVEDLRTALEGFDACPLKKTATNLVFFDGNPAARVMFVGEAPGAEEDRQGLPFVGASGRLLDRMLASIGLDRTGALISNTVYWRPPGNRTPTTSETAICQPFCERLIEIVDPEVLVALGGAAAKTILAQTQGIGRLRGRWFTYSTPRLSHPIDATAMFHPAYLLRSPGQKREAWKDLLMLKHRLAQGADAT